MINNETRRRLEELNLSELIQALEIQEQQVSCQALPFEDRMQLLVDYVYQEKYTNKVKRLNKMAKFRYPHAAIEDIYYTDRQLERNKILGIASCQFMSSNTNIIIDDLLVQVKLSLLVLLERLHVSLVTEPDIFVCQIYYNFMMKQQLQLLVFQN